MKIKANAKGVYYAHLTGSNPINLKTKNLTEAKRLAKEAKLEEIEFAAKANLLTAEAVQRLSAGGKVTGTSALDRWRNLADKALGLTPATRHSYEGHIKRFLVTTKLVDRPISVASFEHVDSFVNAEDEASASTRNMRKGSIDSFFPICTAEGLVVRNPATPSQVRYSFRFRRICPKQKATEPAENGREEEHQAHEPGSIHQPGEQPGMHTDRNE